VAQKTITDFERGITTSQRRIAKDIKPFFKKLELNLKMMMKGKELSF